MPIKMKLGDHWGIVGATGSGKTQFTLQLVNVIARATGGFVPIYILDSKCPISAPEKSDFKHLFRPREGVGKRHTGDKVPPVIRPQGKDFVQIWTPEDDEDKGKFDQWFHNIYKEGRPAIVLIDELSTVTSEAGKGTHYYNILLKQGRGLDISVVSLTQSPSYIPQSLLRQAMHVIRFRLNDEYDSKKLRAAMGRVIEKEPDHEFGFYYRNVQIPVRKAPAREYKDMQEFFGL